MSKQSEPFVTRMLSSLEHYWGFPCALRSHLSVDIVLVEDPRPAASSHVIVEGAVVLRCPQLFLCGQGLWHGGSSWIVSPDSEQTRLLTVI